MILAFDTETTGLPVAGINDLTKQPKIIEFAAIKICDKTLEEVDRIEFLVHPNQPISAKITEITGLKDSDFIKESGSDTDKIIDDTENYIFQRKAIFSNLLQKKIQIVMPGNFSLYTGKIVYLDIPKFTMKDETMTSGLDPTMAGNYIVICTRHIITYQKHETILQVATDTYI